MPASKTPNGPSGPPTSTACAAARRDEGATCSRHSKQRVLLELEQGLLAFDAAGVAGERAVGADHAVARDDDRDGVRAVGEPDRTGGGVGLAETSGDLAVRRGVAVADLGQLVPDRLLPHAAHGGQWQVEVLEVTGEVVA